MDNSEDAKWIQKLHKRIRWTKRILRFVPRRTTIHRYPGLKWAREIAKKRMYLWSFRYREVAPALYVGTIISFLPIIGIQIPLALICALILRANLPVFVALQFITNWLTVVPIYYICYEIGRWSLKVFNIHTEVLSMEELRIFMENIANCHWAENGHFLLHVFLVTFLGGLIIGSFMGTVFDLIYKLLAWRSKIVWERVSLIRARLHEEQAKREEAKKNEASCIAGNQGENEAAHQSEPAATKTDSDISVTK